MFPKSVISTTYLVFIKSTKIFLRKCIYCIFLECKWHILQVSKQNVKNSHWRGMPLWCPRQREEVRADCCSFLFPLTHASLVITLQLMNGFNFICRLQLPFIALGRGQYQMNLANVRFLLLWPELPLKFMLFFQFFDSGICSKSENSNHWWFEVWYYIFTNIALRAYSYSEY